MKILIVGIAVFLSAVTLAYGQREKSQRRFKVDDRKPAVYLELQDSAVENDNQLWFRLHNNTKWSIRLEASGGDPRRDDRVLFYSILSSRDVLKEDFPCRVCSIVLLRSGRNFLFGVPKARLDNIYALRLTFSYEWEDDLDVFARKEPSHYVYFYAKDLSQKP